ncbi:MAG: relaxase/mobilization nuclease domain-containing protein [Microbacteriaceae bacterium]|nr:relaxase/mobilization nuclease domain-containing protein [Microbacteriaceae bacterium]
MIPNITRGDRMAGLMSYLAGKGRHNDHSDQHLVAGDALLEQWGPQGQLDEEMGRRLAHHLDQPRQAFQVEVARGHVWHVSLSLRASEGIQTDEVWGAIARDFVTAMGFDNNPDAAPCRWAAVRHGLSANGNDHIHIAVNLVREDGTKASIHHDYSRAQQAARAIEQRFGLERLESRTTDMGMRGERPGEREVAARRGDGTPASIRLERTVRGVAASSLDEGEFVRRLNQAGVIVRPRFVSGRDDVVAGYSVALRPRPGEPIVWYGGGRLARDLTLPRLRMGWPDTAEGAQAAVDEWRATWGNPMRYRPVWPGREQQEPGADVWREYTDEIRRLRESLSAVDPSDRAAWAHAARDASGALAAWSQRVEPTPGPLAAASRTLARTAQQRSRDARPRAATSTAMHSVAGMARVLAVASTGANASMAEAMLFRELIRLVGTVHRMHDTMKQVDAAKQITASVGARLDAVRSRMPAMVGAEAVPSTEKPTTERAASTTVALDGVAAPNTGSPLPNPLTPHQPQVPTSPGRDDDRGR